MVYQLPPASVTNCQQALPVKEMTNLRTAESDLFRGMDYGYLWWIIDREKKIYAAIGNSDNVIYVNPGKDIVVAVASYFKPTVFDRVDSIREYNK